MIKKFESFGDNIRGWEDDLLLLYDSFVDMEDSNIDFRNDISYQAGFRTSNGSVSYNCYYDKKTEKIEGRKDSINNLISVNGKIALKVLFSFKTHHYHTPFELSNSSSFYKEDADLLLRVMNYINSAKNRLLPKYNMCVTITDNRFFYIEFLEK